ncbi:MAG TPA: ABC transporter substrate-binding protein [Verrucomicrobiae bacterium]|jgi:NitT/TauT family transport system substrate-binding protein
MFRNHLPEKRFLTATNLLTKARALAAVVCGSLFLVACNKSADNSPSPAAASGSAEAAGPLKVRVGYIGLTCEAPIFTAYEKGFFKEENLDVSLVKCDWATYKDSLALGGFDITHHLVMMFLKPIEQGLDVKFLAGIHRGCLRVQAFTNSGIHTVEDLKGKRIGVQGMGTPPFIFANRVLSQHGIDPSKEVTWKVFPPAELGLAMQKGEIDAVADSEPIGTMLSSSGKYRNVADQATDEPLSEEYCCAVVANGKFLANNPKAAAAATRALLKAAKWVEANPQAAAQLSVDKKYLASKPEINATAISHLRYEPSVSGAERAVKTAAVSMKQLGMLNATTDPEELGRRAFAHLDGVSDEWLKSLQVEKVAGGQLPMDLDARLHVEMSTIDDPWCGTSCCNLAIK